MKNLQKLVSDFGLLSVGVDVGQKPSIVPTCQRFFPKALPVQNNPFRALEEDYEYRSMKNRIFRT
jgi:hypothetical protein